MFFESKLVIRHVVSVSSVKFALYVGAQTVSFVEKRLKFSILLN